MKSRFRRRESLLLVLVVLHCSSMKSFSSTTTTSYCSLIKFLLVVGLQPVDYTCSCLSFSMIFINTQLITDFDVQHNKGKPSVKHKTKSKIFIKYSTRPTFFSSYICITIPTRKKRNRKLRNFLHFSISSLKKVWKSIFGHCRLELFMLLYVLNSCSCFRAHFMWSSKFFLGFKCVDERTECRNGVELEGNLRKF